jgi:hypothetical protein
MSKRLIHIVGGWLTVYPIIQVRILTVPMPVSPHSSLICHATQHRSYTLELIKDEGKLQSNLIELQFPFLSSIQHIPR